MQYVPPFLCQLIDAVAFQGNVAELRQDWTAWKEEFGAYFESERDYTLSQADAHIVDNLPLLLQQLEKSVERAFVGECPVDELVQISLEFFEAHDAFFGEREKRYFVANPALDRLIKASIAHIQKRADFQAVLKRVPDAALSIEAVHELYLSARQGLPPEIVDGTVEGFQSAQRGFDIITEHESEIDKEVLEKAIFELKSAGELLEHLPNLFERFEREQGYSIPILGPVLNTLRSEDDEQQFTLLRERAWPAFLDLWESRQDGWLLDPEAALELIPAVDQACDDLAQLLALYPDQEDALWDTLDHLDDLFGQIRESTMQLDELSSSPYWPEAQLMLNLLRGGAPLYAAHSLARGIAEGGPEVPVAVRTVGEALSTYVQDPNPLPLLRALRTLADDLELSQTSRGCPHCGTRIALDAVTCPSCGQDVGQISLSG